MELSKPYLRRDCMTIQEVHERWLNCPLYDLEWHINSHELQAYRCVDSPLKPESNMLHIVKIEETLHCKVDPDEGNMTWSDEKGQVLYADIPECGPDYTDYTDEELYLLCTGDPDEDSMTRSDEEGQELYADTPEYGPNCTDDGLYLLKKDVVKIEQEHPDYVTTPSPEDKTIVIASLELELERLQKRIKELDPNVDENKDLDPNVDGVKNWSRKPTKTKVSKHGGMNTQYVA